MRFTANTSKDEIEKQLLKIEEQFSPLITFLKLSGEYEWTIEMKSEIGCGPSSDFPQHHYFRDITNFRKGFIEKHSDLIKKIKDINPMSGRWATIYVELQINICGSDIKI